MSKLNSINQDQRRYVIKCGKGFTTLGFDYAAGLVRKVNVWLRLNGYPEVPADAAPGTPEAYDQYRFAMSQGSMVSSATGHICPVELHPALVDKEGMKVRVEWSDGEGEHVDKFYVGKSTGWMPVHLELRRRNSRGGAAVCIPEGARVSVC